jgi:hypothetical protein
MIARSSLTMSAGIYYKFKDSACYVKQTVIAFSGICNQKKRKHSLLRSGCKQFLQLYDICIS